MRELLIKHLYKTPQLLFIERPRDIRPQAIETVQDVILRCLAKAPGDRPTSMADVEYSLSAELHTTA